LGINYLLPPLSPASAQFVPEPSTALLLLAGGPLLLLRHRRASFR